jgi:hypothetical protein
MTCPYRNLEFANGATIETRRRADCGARAQAAGGAWLGAGPDGERQTRSSEALARRTGKSRDTLRISGAAKGAARIDSREMRMVSPNFLAWHETAANEANGSAPAGDNPTSTAAHAAASLPLIRRPFPRVRGSVQA